MVAPDLILISSFYEYQRAALERIAPVLVAAGLRGGQAALCARRGVDAGARARLGRQQARAAMSTTPLPKSRGWRAAFAPHGEPAGLRHQPWQIPGIFAHSALTPCSATCLRGSASPTRGPTRPAIAPPRRSGWRRWRACRMPRSSSSRHCRAEVGRTLPENALWNALPAVRENRVALLDPINHFGGLPSARRFARLLARSHVGRSRPWLSARRFRSYLWAGMGLLAAALFAQRLGGQWPGPASLPAGGVDLQRVILFYSVLPRAAVALLAARRSVSPGCCCSACCAIRWPNPRRSAFPPARNWQWPPLHSMRRRC